MENRGKWCFSKDGNNYEVRFFECDNSHDLRDLVLIIESPDVQRWMDDVDGLTFSNYRRWMDNKGENNNFLFAIADIRSENLGENRVHGFVFVYPSKIQEGSLEISYARRPGAPRGLISPAIEVVCNYVYEYLNEKKPWMVPGLMILADIERANIPSIKVVEKAGFKLIGGMDRAKTSIWARGIDMVRTMERGLAGKMERVCQLNNSYCAPATLAVLLQHYGIEADQEQIVSAASTKEHVVQHGMSIEMLGLAVRNLYPEKRLWAKRDSSLADVEKMVRVYNYPVGMDWQGIFESNDYEKEDLEISSDPLEENDPNHICKGDAGHYSVVVDVDRANDNVRITDPYGNFAKEDRFVEVQDFLNRWWDDRMDTLPDGSKKYVYENRLMFVVVPESVRLPEELGMTEL
ncbi:MAG TPA: GNAT family N-acetyltransferase [Spirochaetia bacterium]|nr:GNAT family N-acetyltransferase [Spirochaetia bacterium]